MLMIRIVSDVHLEFHHDVFMIPNDRANEKLLEILPKNPDDKDTVLIVAGDVASATQPQRIITFLGHVLPRFKHVIYVLGNHEHYRGNLTTTQGIITKVVADELGECSNLTIAGNNVEEVSIDGVRFLCATMWTDYGAATPNKDYIRKIISCYINDHKAISLAKGAVQPDTLADIFAATVMEFGLRLSGKDNSKTVIVTHHMPSFSAVHPQYRSNDTVTKCLNHAFASDLDDFICEHKPAAWIFGHTHSAYHSNVGDTQIICNPRGYPLERVQEGWEYNPNKAIMV